MSAPTPILFLGDSPNLRTGLGRIGRDIALATSRMPEFRVGFLGRGGQYDRRLPFAQYNYDPTAQYASEWGDHVLPEVAANFAEGEHFIIMTLWDPFRVAPWFGNPSGPMTRRARKFFDEARFERWGYFAIDGQGPVPNEIFHSGLTGEVAIGLSKYDRLLAYSKFGYSVLRGTLDGRGPAEKGFWSDIDWAPHGLNLSVFYPRDRVEARRRMSALFERGGMGTTRVGEQIIGCVMANQPRKDWGVWAEAMAGLRDSGSYVNARYWVHTDSIDRYWDLRALIADFRLEGSVLVTMDDVSDDEMAWRYSACDLTVLPSRGEGFGYPIVESQACGVPCLHTNYAGGAELVEKDMLVDRVGVQLDTRWNVYRAVLDPAVWTKCIRDYLIYGPRANDAPPYASAVENVAHLGWKKLWPSVWQKWMLKGLEQMKVAEASA